MVAFVGEKKESIFKAVSGMYSDVANYPGRQFHFPTGRPACLFVGYPSIQLDAISETAVESFAGVGYPFAVGAIQHSSRSTRSTASIFLCEEKRTRSAFDFAMNTSINEGQYAPNVCPRKSWGGGGKETLL